jgi:hypothetical protein
MDGLQETFGFFIDGLLNEEDDTADMEKAKKKYRDAVKLCFFKHLKLYRQRNRLKYVVDIFIDEASIDIGEDEEVTVNLTHIPYKVEGAVIKADYKMSDYDLRVIADYKEHFPQFDELLKLLCASRFATTRKKAFLWLHVQSDWGKGFLISVFKELRIVTEVSVKEIEKAFEGGAIGKNASNFRRSLILVVDEFKNINPEIKQLEDSVRGSAKYELEFEVELYLKLFTSASFVPSMAGEEGVEAQLGNRFSYMRPVSSKIDDRPLIIASRGRYRLAVARYIAQTLNISVDEMRALGREEATNRCDGIVDAFHKEHTIANRFGSLEDTVQEWAIKLREILINFGRNPSVWGDLPRELHQTLKLNGTICKHKGLGNVVVLQKPTRFISDLIESSTNKSQKGSVKLKAGEIAELCDELGCFPKDPFKISGGRTIRGIVVKIPDLRDAKSTASLTHQNSIISTDLPPVTF